MSRRISYLTMAALTPLAVTAIASPLQQPSVPSAPAVAPRSNAAASSQSSAATAWPVTSGPVHRIVLKGVPNFGELNSGFWRSGQPTRDGYKKLASLGLKTVVNLRSEFPQDKDLVPAGVHYFYIPIRDQHTPTDAQAKQFIDIVSDPSNWPILVHCQGGEGRAGLMSALVRHSFDGWSDEAVKQETSNFRISYLGFMKFPMPGSQQRFIKNWEDSTGRGTAVCKVPSNTEASK